MTQAPHGSVADRSAVAELSRRRARVLGALGVAGVSTLVAALSHGAAGGGWPTPLVLAAALPFSVFLSLPLLGARVSSWRIALTVLLDQAVFHALFSTIGQTGAAAAAMGTSAPAGAHHAEPLAVLLDAEGGLAAAQAALTPAMLAGHLAAAAVSFALLRGGWQLLLRALARGARILLRVLGGLPAPVALPPRAAAAATASPPSLRVVVLRHARSLRGPPLPAPLG